MRRLSLVRWLTLAVGMALPAAALADPDAGTISDPDCTVAKQSMTDTCGECDVTSSDTSCALQFGSDYNFVCSQSATVQIWCNGPNRDQSANTSATSCALGAMPPPSAGSIGLLIAAAAFAVSRRRAR